MIKRLVLGTAFEPILRKLFNRPKENFVNSAKYWDNRYKNGNSGAGSYGRLAEFKAEILNEFVKSNNISEVVEFGCGDGNQLLLANYPEYTGLDISPSAVAICRKLFQEDPSKRFYVYPSSDTQKAMLCISLDVIYHLVEDSVYEDYMNNLFTTASKFVVIYSSNYTDDYAAGAAHVRHRCFVDWVTENAPYFNLSKIIKNRYPYDENNPDNTSLADFYIFEKS
jgi:hypothetical protein